MRKRRRSRLDVFKQIAVKVEKGGDKLLVTVNRETYATDKVSINEYDLLLSADEEESELDLRWPFFVDAAQVFLDPQETRIITSGGEAGRKIGLKLDLLKSFLLFHSRD
ncbi:MAG: hypothetical protein QXZ31_05665 [Thermofilaceae archaeon]